MITDKKTNIIAILLLSITFLIGFFSVKNNSLTFDELSHIPAGYSYLTQQDFRINPEHPPFIKDLSAIPLLFLDLNFPSESSAWQEGINNQWDFGNKFIFHSGNNADQIVFLARIPMLFVLVFLGWFLFKWAKEKYGNKTALFVLVLFSFSPSLIAHGRLVTTDLGATFGFVVSTYFWLKFLKNPSRKNIIITSLVFGFTILLKFSMALLVPFFGIITLIYVFLKNKNLFEYLIKSVLVGLIAVIFVVWPVYQWHVMNYPPERQLRDTTRMLAKNFFDPLRNLLISISNIPILRSLGLYFTGLLMATQRTMFGNTTFFLGKLNNASFKNYFQIVYLLKAPIALHVLTITALLVFIVKRFKKQTQSIKEKLKNNFTELSMLIFLAIYWLTSAFGNLNLGIRHLLPVFPFTYMLVSSYLVKSIQKSKKQTIKVMGSAFILFSLGWYSASSVLNYPYYIPYFNEMIGTNDGYKYVVDSNYDWGQDLKRLKKWVEENNIEKIKIDYFGGADVNYYFPEKAEWFDARKEKPKGYIAVSATLLQSGTGKPLPSFEYDGGYYRWLQDYKPIAKAGKSIFIYYIP